MSLPAPDPLDRSGSSPGDEVSLDAGPLGLLPRLGRRQLRLGAWLARGTIETAVRDTLAGLGLHPELDVAIGRAEVLDRPVGIARPGVIAQCSWTEQGTRLAVGLETPVAHALVDRLLGFDRLSGEERLQVTPVEWGVLTGVALRLLDRLDPAPGPPRWTLDRVSPEPFDDQDLGPIVTVRWPVRIGSVAGSIRLWIPDSLLSRAALDELPSGPPSTGVTEGQRFGDLATSWSAVAGFMDFPRGLGRLRVGRVVLPTGRSIPGTPQDPRVPLELVAAGAEVRTWFPAEPVPMTAGARLTIAGPMHQRPVPRERPAMATSPPPPSSTPSPTPAGDNVPPTEVPVTLAIELGRITLPLRRVADLKPGDVLELGRHAREPVELTSGGRLIARGELVQVETELGVRIVSVFL